VAPGAAIAPVLNARTLPLLGISGLLFWLATRYKAAPEAVVRARDAMIALCVLTATVVVLVVVTAEINAAYGVYAWERATDAGPMAAGAADLARQVTLSIVWASFALVLVAVGIARSYAPIRYLAIVLFAVTIGKVLLVDLASLDRVYRVLSVLGLGVLLIVASYLYQRFLSDEA
jgi:uncharacterized membrane protein